jgi:hypothetical protein
MLSSLISRQLAAEPYLRFANVMGYWGYHWEAKEVTTEDGYILTNFHIVGYGDEPFD